MLPRHWPDNPSAPPRRHAKKLPAWVALVCLTVGPILLGMHFALRKRNAVQDPLVGAIGIAGILATLVGVVCLFAVVFAMFAEWLAKKQWTQLFYRSSMLAIGIGLVGWAVFLASMWAIPQAFGTLWLAAICLYFGAVRGMNPRV